MSLSTIRVRCSVCGFRVTPDEIVIGAYNGAPNERFDILWAPGETDEATFDFTVPEGYLAYCIDDAPCECGYHPDLMSDTAAQEQGWCFDPDCSGHAPVRMAHRHGAAA